MSMEHAQTALSLAQSTGNNGRQSDLFRHFAFIKYRIGDYTAGQVYAKEAHRLARITGHLYIEAQGLLAEAANWMALGNYMQSTLLLDRARSLLHIWGLPRSNEGHSLMIQLGAVHSHKSEYVEAHSVYNEVAQATVNDPYVLGISLLNMADIEVSMGTAKHNIQRKINSAQTLFKGFGIARLSVVCDMVQADLNLREGDMQKEKLGIHKGLQFIGDIFLQENDENRAECMICLGDISEKNGDLLNALELWEMARPLFKRSSQTKQIQAIDERMSRVDQDVKEQHQKNLAHLVTLSVPAGRVDEEDEGDSETELELDEAEVERVVV
ncbi:hypothetical protein B0H16DRAFT_1459831 [Mycena metata]|uniref:MalT-like TPR region domain-containing protein n=1 Tax=Mycena metata TaxID=1033252 RepID=A0AAD7IZJ0_9AGAR|nr:hypothetical protein B0H16DRAFT_1459831 [Mycena metata]